ncbi:MAG: 2-succinyl-6-hydroxy-2,4-cyclohexadiene-1-carboxylate synthase [SAR324 cluster bacterium]|nr:2-succinyl-6-hydroxy-2,4-cyclohexadiene-1-carboxylate synthase [SAR324 cluster bacterium]
MNLHWHQKGETPSKKMVFLHGFLGSGLDFTDLMQPLSSVFHCLAPDLPGHGQSLFKKSIANEGLRSFRDVASLILEQMPGKDSGDFVLYGYSMGGRIAQAMCLQAPERIRHLFLESASFGIRNVAARQERYRKDCSLFKGLITEAEFRHFLEKWHHLPLFSSLRQTPLLEELIASKQKNNARQLDRALTLMSVGNQPWLPPDLNRIDVPITYLYGEQDRKYTSIAQDARQAIPRISLKKFAQASHNIHIQFVPEIVAALKEILT